ncbi:hypothetical protein [Nostoc sp.]
MLQYAIQGWLQVASEREELAPEKELVEISRSKRFQVKHFVKFWNGKVGN